MRGMSGVACHQLMEGRPFLDTHRVDCPDLPKLHLANTADTGIQDVLEFLFLSQ